MQLSPLIYMTYATNNLPNSKIFIISLFLGDIYNANSANSISKTASSWKLGRPLLCSKQLIFIIMNLQRETADWGKGLRSVKC